MTRAKKASKAEKMPSMAEQYRSLPQDQQEAIITFFNLHNASTFVFNQMSDKAQDYCRYCIEMSQEQENVKDNNA